MLLKACTYYVEILNSFNPKLELKDAEFSIKKRLKKILSELRGFKLVATLVLVFKKIESQDKTKYDIFHSNSKAEIIINDSEIDNLLESLYATMISDTKIFRKGCRLDYSFSH